MDVAGIIVEFNPFHNGHKYHIEETKKIAPGGVIAVMSGNFVQRGQPAICDKWRRTRMALLNGVDIVVEIPAPYVVCGADYFARGSVGLLVAMGVVDTLSFGSECGDLEAIRKAGKILAEEPDLYREKLRDGMKNGLSFAAAKGTALEAVFVQNGEILPEGLLNKPNNGLGMEYCKYLHDLGNKMKVITTPRKSGGATATGIRRKFFDGENIGGLMPDVCKEILFQGETAQLDDFSDIFRYLLYTSDVKMGEGLENRFREFAGKLGNYSKISELLDVVKTKRYVYTRLQRLVVQTILGIGAEDVVDVPYIRVLGFRREAAGLLGQMVKKAALPVITSGAAMDEILKGGGVAGKMLAKEFEVGDIYRLATGATGGYRSERGIGIVVL